MASAFIKLPAPQIGAEKTLITSDEPGEKGQVYWDENYVYICVDKDTWKRLPLEAW